VTYLAVRYDESRGGWLANPTSAEQLVDMAVNAFDPGFARYANYRAAILDTIRAEAPAIYDTL
ncbi:Mycobacterium numidiamassiliense ORFan, partial [Mycobacterium numidiamassiliense]